MSDLRDEKFDEKEAEKREEKAPEEKQWEEKYRRDPLGIVIWGLILVWAGGVLLALNLGILDNLLGKINAPQWLYQLTSGWSLVFIGVAGILLIEILVRLAVPAYRRSVVGQVILSIIFLALGLSNLVNWNIIWPIILIGLGLILVMRSLTKNR